MGAIGAGCPAMYMPAGPMLRGNWHGQLLGTGSDIWKYWADKRAGLISDAHWDEMETGIARSDGLCMTMGTAATMTAFAEVLGFRLPGASSIPAADANHPRCAAACGRRIVAMVSEKLASNGYLNRRNHTTTPSCAAAPRRFDQCYHPSDRHGAPRRHRDLKSNGLGRTNSRGSLSWRI